MKFPRSFIALLLRFAEVVADIGDLPFDETLRLYTPLFPNFELDRTQGAQDPVWQEYVAGLYSEPDATAWTLAFYERRYQPYVPQNRFGCFSYSVWSDGRIRLHFLQDGAERCLRHSNREARLQELKHLFSDVKQRVTTPGNIVGGSWLYHIDAYRRLFPPAFLASAQVGPLEYPFMALWGQFLDYQGDVKSAPATQLLDCLGRQTSLDAIGDCFPFSVLRLEAPVEPFYTHYDIQ